MAWEDIAADRPPKVYFRQAAYRKNARLVAELVLPQPVDHILDHEVEECAAVACAQTCDTHPNE